MNISKLPEGFSWAEEIQLGSPEVYRLSELSWPRFLLEESDIPDPILKFQLSLEEFQEKFKVFGIRHDASGLLVAFIQAVHVQIDLAATELPALGWRFSIQDASRRSVKNAISLVEASVDSDYRGYGLSRFLIERVKYEARLRKFQQIVAPVRPTMKVKFPTEPIEVYCARKDTASRIFDPWLRTHVEAGAVVMNICHDSVCVEATLDKWREWTGYPMDTNGPVLVEGALMPVLVDLQANRAIYREPNVWVRYCL